MASDRRIDECFQRIDVFASVMSTIAFDADRGMMSSDLLSRTTVFDTDPALFDRS